MSAFSAQLTSMASCSEKDGSSGCGPWRRSQSCTKNSGIEGKAALAPIDHQGACSADRDGVLSSANLKTINQKNGHGHAVYYLKTPVATSTAARVGPLKFMAAVELGIRRRLEADPNYAGYLVKNPLHRDWHTITGNAAPYSLTELSDWLHRPDLKFTTGKHEAEGYGRDVTVFDDLRSIAYREVRTF